MDFIDITLTGTDGKGGLQRWEGSVPFLYLDNRSVNGRPSPLVTFGIGCAAGPASYPTASAELLGLAWMVGTVAATPAEIQAQYAAVCAAPFGYVAEWYGRLTTMRLSEDAQLQVCRNRLGQFVEALEEIFPAFASWPEPCKAGALDLIYGLGVTGFGKYHQCIQACLAGNWAEAAAQCASDANLSAYDARNAARKALFLSGVPAAETSTQD